jgi:hypothetical protein
MLKHEEISCDAICVYKTQYYHLYRPCLREAGRVKDSLGDKESNIMERLKDGQVKLGVTRYEHYAEQIQKF